MKRKHETQTLRAVLSTFETDTIEAIRLELKRLGRTVAIDELEANPFTEEASIFMDAIRIDIDGSVTIDTSYNDVEEKSLLEILHDLEIGHWDMVQLLEMLRKLDY